MATKNKRVVGYVDPADHDRLRQFMEEFGCTESKAIALILQSYFSGNPISTATSKLHEAEASTPSSTLFSTPVATPDILERLATLEAKLETLSSTNGTPEKLDSTIAEHIERSIQRQLEGWRGEFAA